MLWLRHSFAHAFSGDSMPVDCNASARNDEKCRMQNFPLCHVSVSETSLFVIARGVSLVAIKRVKRSKTVDCLASFAMTQDYHLALFLRHCEQARWASAAIDRIEHFEGIAYRITRSFTSCEKSSASSSTRFCMIFCRHSSETSHASRLRNHAICLIFSGG